MNGYLWRVQRVSEDSHYLIDRTNTLTVATTDFDTKTVYISEALHGNFLRTVLTHELGHCTMFSYGILDDIHSFVDYRHWVEAEEWVCNFIADYGAEVFSIVDYILTNGLSQHTA